MDHYRYSGHSALMGKRKRDWQDTDKVLALFANRPSPARGGYRQFVEEGIEMGRRPELTGGGLIRSAGGWVALKSGKEGRDQTTGDERILGEGGFVESVLRHLEKIKIRALLVYGTVFCVAPRVTYNEYAPLGTP
ncbi:MAG: hypothetical protein GY792_30140 [Gammaproteobacteria bacterium]|nr:hypothetical protein [Gammaproteobacteria bacterium]